MEVNYELYNVVWVWGAGREGRSARDFLRTQNYRGEIYFVSDAAPPEDLGEPYLEQNAFLKEQSSFLRNNVEPDRHLVIRSPGVSVHSAAFQQVAKSGVQITSGTNLWLEHAAFDTIIGVTGTKGKSTVATLIHHALRELGRDSHLMGNIGMPLLDGPMNGDVAVLELSSYQIADLTEPVDIAVLTSLFSDHLDWHGSKAQYHHDKLRLFDSALSRETMALKPYANAVESAGGRVTRNLDQATLSREASGEVRRGRRVVATHFPLKGDHNLDNLALSLSVVERIIGESLPPVDFAGYGTLPHRLSETRLDNGVLIVDDSIATIPEATIGALGIYGASVRLFVGGSDRGIDYSALVAHLLGGSSPHLYLFGPAGRRIDGELGGDGPKRDWYQTLTDAIDAACRDVNAGDVMLLSPAAPSFDEFRNFVERGDYFVARIREALES